MASVAIRCSVSSTGEENSGENLDPRIYEELDKLNRASENINHIELQLEEARLTFRQLLSESTKQLDALSQKLGSCIEKSRPYYEARFALKEAQLATQSAAICYERACSQLAAAKEMVNLAEQGYFKQNQQFDPAWQEMLNHSTMKVNECEHERLESELEHMKVAQLLNEAEQRVNKLKRDWKRNIAKSRPYFELKAKVNQQMEERKKRILKLEQQISVAKKLYAETLQNLERISEEIHIQRQHERRWHEKKAQKLARAVGNEMIVYHPLMDAVSSSSSEDDSGNETLGDVDSTELAVPPLMGAGAVKNVTVRQIDCVPNTSDCRVPAASSVAVDAVKPHTVAASTHLNPQQTESSVERTNTPADNAQAGSLSPSIHRASSVSDSISPVSPESDIEQLQANAAVMAAISRSKLQRVACPFLRPDSCREELSVNGGSETESVSGSFVSGGIGALDDEQIESLMVDVTDYQRIVDDMDTTESDRCRQMALPARFRHLQDFMKFEPVWIDDGEDAGGIGATQNSDVEHLVTETKVADDHVFVDGEIVEFISTESHSSGHPNTNTMVDKKECQVNGDSVWHPLMDNGASTTATSVTHQQ